MKCWTPNPFYYDFGRPFPSNHVIDLLDTCISKSVDKNKSIQVYEPCSGTGRIVIPLAKKFPLTHFVASDHSSSMLTVMRHRMICENIKNLEIVEADISQFIPEKKCDLILICAALHVIPKWKEALQHLINQLTPTGTICLLGEEADIYNQALGRPSSFFNQNELDNHLKTFWETYLLFRTELGIEHTESSQVGCPWEINNQAIVDYLEQLGFAELNKTEIHWQHHFHFDDLLQIVKERCYSSMFTVDPNTYESLVLQLVQNQRIMSLKHKKIISRHRAIGRFMNRF